MLNPKRSKIFAASLEGVKLAIQRNLEIDNVEFSPNPYYYRTLLRTKGKIKFPACFYTPTTGTSEIMSYNREALRRFGIKGGIDRSGQTWLIYHLTPVQVDLTCHFIMDDETQFKNFFQDWMFREKKFTFTLNVDVLNITCQIQIGRTINMAQQEFTQEVGKLFQFDTTISLFSWVGTIQQVPTICEVDGQWLTFNLETDLRNIPQDILDAVSADPDIIVKFPSTGLNPEI